MNRLIFIMFLALTAVLAFSSCEQVIEGADFPYVEQMVIQGVLEVGSPIEVRITKTLPATAEFTIEKAELKDAVVILTIDNIQFSLGYTQQGLYTNERLKVVAGKTYNLEVSWNGKKATAYTTVPAQTSINSIYRKVTPEKGWDGYQYYLVQYYSKVTPIPNAVFVGGKNEYSKGQTTPTNTDYSEQASIPDTKIGQTEFDVLNFSEYSNDSLYYENPNPISTYEVFVEVYDPQFMDYFKTRERGMNDGGSIFGVQGSSVKWNISGDGIGLFIGRSTVARFLTN